MSVKPLNLDTQRIQRILKDLKENVLISSFLFSSDIRENKLLAPHLSEPVIELIQQHAEMHEEFLQLVSTSEALEQAQEVDATGRRASVFSPIKKLTRDIVFRVKKIPGALSKLNAASTKSDQAINFGRVLSELEESTMFRLCTTVEEDRARQEQSVMLGKLEIEKESQKTKLTEDLAKLEETAEKAKSLNKKLLDELVNAQESHNSEVTRKTEELKTNHTNLLALYTSEYTENKQKLTNETADFQAKLLKITENLENEHQSLRSLQQKRLQETNKAIGLLEKEKNSLVELLQSEEKAYAADLEEIKMLTQHFSEGDKEDLKKKQNEILKELKEKKRVNDESRLNFHADIVQAVWRGIKTRQEFAKKNGKKAAKKEGKKKK
jgi:hypothetical protein